MRAGVTLKWAIPNPSPPLPTEAQTSNFHKGKSSCLQWDGFDYFSFFLRLKYGKTVKRKKKQDKEKNLKKKKATTPPRPQNEIFTKENRHSYSWNFSTCFPFLASQKKKNEKKKRKNRQKEEEKKTKEEKRNNRKHKNKQET